jgi:hypothetical protein
MTLTNAERDAPRHANTAAKLVLPWPQDCPSLSTVQSTVARTSRVWPREKALLIVSSTSHAMPHLQATWPREKELSLLPPTAAYCHAANHKSSKCPKNKQCMRYKKHEQTKKDCSDAKHQTLKRRVMVSRTSPSRQSYRVGAEHRGTLAVSL